MTTIEMLKQAIAETEAKLKAEESERAKLVQALGILNGAKSNGNEPKKHNISPEGLERISRAMKKRWAEHKKHKKQLHVA